MPTPQLQATMVTREIQDPDWTLPVIRVMRVHETVRAKDLRHWCSFVDGTQHDHCETNWGGGYRDPGVQYMHERLAPQGFVPTSSVPYGERRPDTPDPLAAQIVQRFADMLVAGGAFPAVRAPADARTERYLAAILAKSNTGASFHEARQLSGACGEAAVLLEVVEGVPTSEVLNTQYLDVKWRQVADWIPESVTEQRPIWKRVEERGHDGKTKMVRKRYLRTRYWDEVAAVTFEDVPENYGQDRDDQDDAGNPKPIPITSVTEHRAGRCPVVWLQNTRNTESPTGKPDLVNQQVMELCDKHDRVSSMATRATIAGTDPTLVLKRSRMTQRMGGLLRKGYGARLEVGTDGDAKFLEISGETIRVAWESADRLRDKILQTCSCVLIDPKTSGTEKSGEAVQMLWRSMEDRCDSFRVSLSTAIVETCQIWISLGRAWGVASSDGVEVDEGTRAADAPIILPPHVEAPDDPETEAQDPKLSAHDVGEAWHVELDWPPYHRPTALQLQATANALSTATGQRPVLSQRSGVEVFGGMLGRVDAAEELRRIRQEEEARTSKMEGLLAGAGQRPPPPGRSAASDDGGDEGEGGEGEGGEAGRSDQGDQDTPDQED